MSPGAIDRERYLSRMQAVAVGAKLARRFVWVVARQVRRDTSVELTLKRGRRSIVVNVGVCHSGPDLFWAGLRPIAPAPEQQQLRMAA